MQIKRNLQLSANKEKITVADIIVFSLFFIIFSPYLLVLYMLPRNLSIKKDRPKPIFIVFAIKETIIFLFLFDWVLDLTH